MLDQTLPLAFVVGAAVLVVSVLAVRLSIRVGLPGLLFFLALGLALERVLGIDDPALAQTLGLAGLVVILAEGGLTTSWSHVRRAVPAALVLATVGVGVSTAVVAVAAHLLVGLDWQLAILLGAIVSSTDAAAVFSVLRRLPLPPRLSGILEAESGFNDAPGVILVVAFSSVAGEVPDSWHLLGEVVFELLAGAAIGLAVGWLGGQLVRRVALPASGLYPLTVLGLAIGAYGAAALVHASGFLAVYLAGVVLGNMRLPHGPATRGFAEGVGWLAQIGLFVMLGLTAFPERLPGAIGPALLVGVGLLLARPIAVVVCLVWFRMPWREHAFLSWAGLRGAVPIVLATIPATAGIDGSDRLFDIVFVLVVLFTVLQAPTLPWLARKLGVVTPAEPRELDVESAPLEDLGADLLQLRIPRESELAGVEVFELRLPQDSAVTLVVRGGHGFVPGPETILRAGDQLLVVTTARSRDRTEQRLRAVSRRGRLAGWLGER